MNLFKKAHVRVPALPRQREGHKRMVITSLTQGNKRHGQIGYFFVAVHIVKRIFFWEKKNCIGCYGYLDKCRDPDPDGG